MITYDQATTDTSDDTEEALPYLDAVAPAISAEGSEILQGVFAFVPFGMNDIYKYDDNSSDDLSLITSAVELGQ